MKALAAAAEDPQVPVVFSRLCLRRRQGQGHPVTDEGHEQPALIIDVAGRHVEHAWRRPGPQEARHHLHDPQRGLPLRLCPALQAVEHLQPGPLGQVAQHGRPPVGVVVALPGAPRLGRVFARAAFPGPPDVVRGTQRRLAVGCPASAGGHLAAPEAGPRSRGAEPVIAVDVLSQALATLAHRRNACAAQALPVHRALVARSPAYQAQAVRELPGRLWRCLAELPEAGFRGGPSPLSRAPVAQCEAVGGSDLVTAAPPALSEPEHRVAGGRGEYTPARIPAQPGQQRPVNKPFQYRAFSGRPGQGDSPGRSSGFHEPSPPRLDRRFRLTASTAWTASRIRSWPGRA
jgi:hypothetical protein